MKRLFTVNGTHFDNKVDAKKARGQFIQGKDGKPGRFEHEVHLGPDHRHYGEGKLKRGQRTHSHNNRSGGHGNGFPNVKKSGAKRK